MSKCINRIIVLLFVLMIYIPGIGYADDPKAREIMEKVGDMQSSDSSVSDLTMILVDKNDKERIRKIRTFTQKNEDATRTITFFLYPADVKDSSFLTYAYEKTDQETDQWLYLPALRKVKRIASSEKGGSFMGSDFSYSDMSARKLDDFDFELRGERNVRGHKTWIIEATPRSESVIEETGYKKSYLCVRQDNYITVQAIMEMEKEGARKYLDVKELEKVDGYWVARETHMIRKKGNRVEHKTILKVDNIKHDQKFDEGLFTTWRMEKGL